MQVHIIIISPWNSLQEYRSQIRTQKTKGKEVQAYPDLGEEKEKCQDIQVQGFQIKIMALMVGTEGKPPSSDRPILEILHTWRFLRKCTIIS